jgi:lipopolysaccharide/colanic/teichoic acid biosynthesis glycosyltransferase
MQLVYRRRRGRERVGRLIDILVACSAFALLWPVMAAAALGVAIEDRGPILFKQRRVGRYGRLFTIYKLRTMCVARCADGLKPRDAADPRITRIGRVLRRTSIDELPQLFNVISGDMAIVGPRPEMPFVVRGYEPWQHLRHLVKPGITGLWQTTCRSTVPLEHPEATKLDLDYIRRASLGTDAYIIARTVVALVSARGAV